MLIQQTWTVSFFAQGDQGNRVNWRVPDGDLAAVLNVLRFNGVVGWEVSPERTAEGRADAVR